jgi:hypothetical protein
VSREAKVSSLGLHHLQDQSVELARPGPALRLGALGTLRVDERVALSGREGAAGKAWGSQCVGL